MCRSYLTPYVLLLSNSLSGFLLILEIFLYCMEKFLRQSLTMYPWLAGTHYVDQAGFKLMEIRLPLPPEN